MVRIKIPMGDGMNCLGCKTREEAEALADLVKAAAGVRRWIFENGGAETKVIIMGDGIEVREDD